MNLKKKNGSELIHDLKNLRGREKDIVAQILNYLKEIESRKLYLERSWSSMYEFCLNELGYSKDEAYIRIQGMRALKSVPEVEEKIRTGDLTLSVLAKTQIAFNKENQRRKEGKKPALSQQEKAQVLSAVEKSSTRDCDRVLATLFPEVQSVPEKTKPLSDEKTLIQFTANKELMTKLEKLKGLLAHKNYSGHWEGLFNELADIALLKLDPLAERNRRISVKKTSKETYLAPTDKQGEEPISISSETSSKKSKSRDIQARAKKNGSLPVIRQSAQAATRSSAETSLYTTMQMEMPDQASFCDSAETSMPVRKDSQKSFQSGLESGTRPTTHVPAQACIQTESCVQTEFQSDLEPFTRPTPHVPVPACIQTEPSFQADVDSNMLVFTQTAIQTAIPRESFTRNGSRANQEACIRITPQTSAPSHSKSSLQVPDSNPTPVPTPLVAKRGARRHYLSVHLKREIWLKAGSRCEYRNPRTGERCLSRHALQIDHRRPLALGGADDISNLRLLCGEHNRYLAWKIWGHAKHSRS